MPRRGDVERADGHPVVGPEPADRMVARIEPLQDGQRVAAGGPVPARQRAGAGSAGSARSVASGTISSGRDGSSGVPTSDLSGDHLEAVRRIEPPAEPRLRDECVEHPPLPSTGSCCWRVMVGSRVMVTAVFFASYHFEKAVEVISSSCRPSGVRVSSARTLNRYVPSPATVTTSLVLPIGAAKIASVSAWLSWPLAIQPRSPPVLAVGASELSRARTAKSAPLSACALRSFRWSMSDRAIHDLDDVPAEGGLDRRQDVAGA